MLTPEQIQEVLTSTEADRIERTRSTKDTDKFREAICSFSNDMHFRTYDVTPCLGSTLDDLDLDVFVSSYRRKAIDPEVIKENGRELVLQLAALHFYNLKRDCPTNAGCIVFGKDVLGRFPGSYVQYVKFAGETLGSDVVESRVFNGNLLELMWTVSRFIASRFTEKPVFDSGLRERIIWDYPPEAMRELLVNAVLHRDYQSNSPVRFYFYPDRIEIMNTGGLYGEVSKENFPHVTDYRNPVLAEVLMVMKYANRYGRGISKAQALLAENGNRPAEFEIESNYIKVTVFKHPER